MPSFAYYFDGGTTPPPEPTVVSIAYGDTQISSPPAEAPNISWTQAIGAAALNRHVVVALSLNASPDLIVTVAGQACTKVVSQVSGRKCEIWVTNAPVTGGTHATVLLTGAHATNLRACSSTFALYGAATPTAPVTGAASAGPFSVAMTIPTGGVAIGAMVSNGLTSFTWSSFVEDADIQNTPSTDVNIPITHTAAHRATAGAFTETVTPGAGLACLLVTAVWSP